MEKTQQPSTFGKQVSTRAGEKETEATQSRVEEGRARVASSSEFMWRPGKSSVCEPGCPAETGDLESICLLC